MMGRTASGLLVYGYDLGGPEDGWKIAEADECGDWEPEWSTEDDVIDAAGRRLRASVGFEETDRQADGYWERAREADVRTGVEFGCVGPDESWVLCAFRVDADGSETVPLDFVELAARAEREGWDARLARAVVALGITPTQERPQWLLASAYG